MATIGIKLKSYDELIFEITKLNTDIYLKDKEIERLNNDIKELLKENSNREKVIKIQDNIINKANEYIKVCKSNDMGIRYQRIEEILQGSDKDWN